MTCESCATGGFSRSFDDRGDPVAVEKEPEPPPVDPCPVETTPEPQEIHSEVGTRSERRVLRTRNRLLSAALSLFSNHGIDATTIEEITERADLGKGTFYRHFQNKEEVVLALVEESIDRLIKQMHSAKPQPSLAKVLERIFDVHARFFTSQREGFEFLFHAQLLKAKHQGTESSLWPLLDRYVRDIRGQLQPYLPASVLPERIHLISLSVVGLLSGMFLFVPAMSAEDEQRKGLKPLRRAFISGCQALVEEKP
jgi:AcrR family transcriptional regulator